MTPEAEGKKSADKAGNPREVPLTVIRPTCGWGSVNLGELWRYRELMYFFFWRDLKARYKQRVLGVLWAIIGPLVSMLVFTLFFGRFAGLQEQLGDIPYPVFVYAGLLSWNLFNKSVMRSCNSVVTNAQIITKVYFPRMLTPISSMGVNLLDYGIAFCVLLVIMVVYRVPPTPAILMVAPLTLMTLIAALGIGLFASALHVAYRDFGQIVSYALQILFFATPVIWPPSIVPPRWQWLLPLNPMAGFVEGFRSAILPGQPFDWIALRISTCVALLALTVGVLCFRRLERHFADVI